MKLQTRFFALERLAVLVLLLGAKSANSSMPKGIENFSSNLLQEKLLNYVTKCLAFESPQSVGLVENQRQFFNVEKAEKMVQLGNCASNFVSDYNLCSRMAHFNHSQQVDIESFIGVTCALQSQHGGRTKRQVGAVGALASGIQVFTIFTTLTAIWAALFAASGLCRGPTGAPGTTGGIGPPGPDGAAGAPGTGAMLPSDCTVMTCLPIAGTTMFDCATCTKST